MLGGYCFRFAVRGDLRVLLGDEDLVRRAAEELRPLPGPFPLLDGPSAHPYTPYAGTPAFRLPGQGIAGRLSEPGRIAYARLVLHGQHDRSRWVFGPDAPLQLVEHVGGEGQRGYMSVTLSTAQPGNIGMPDSISSG